MQVEEIVLGDLVLEEEIDADGNHCNQVDDKYRNLFCFHAFSPKMMWFLRQAVSSRGTRGSRAISLV